jgi:transposase
MAKQATKHTEEFKRDALRLMKNRGKCTVARIADDLGVTAGMWYRWADKLGKESTTLRNEHGETLEAENRRRRRENEQFRVERAILKRPTAFFARESEQTLAASSWGRRPSST